MCTKFMTVPHERPRSAISAVSLRAPYPLPPRKSTRNRVVTQFAVLGLDACRQLQIASSTEKGVENSNPSIAQSVIRKPPPGAVEKGSSCRSKNPAVTIPATIPRSGTDTTMLIIFTILMPRSQRHYAPIDPSI